MQLVVVPSDISGGELMERYAVIELREWTHPHWPYHHFNKKMRMSIIVWLVMEDRMNCYTMIHHMKQWLHYMVKQVPIVTSGCTLKLIIRISWMLLLCFSVTKTFLNFMFSTISVHSSFNHICWFICHCSINNFVNLFHI